VRASESSLLVNYDVINLDAKDRVRRARTAATTNGQKSYCTTVSRGAAVLGGAAAPPTMPKPGLVLVAAKQATRGDRYVL